MGGSWAGWFLSWWFMGWVVPGLGGSWVGWFLSWWFLGWVVPGLGGSWAGWFLGWVVPELGGRAWTDLRLVREARVERSRVEWTSRAWEGPGSKRIKL